MSSRCALRILALGALCVGLSACTNGSSDDGNADATGGRGATGGGAPGGSSVGDGGSVTGGTASGASGAGGGGPLGGSSASGGADPGGGSSATGGEPTGAAGLVSGGGGHDATGGEDATGGDAAGGSGATGGGVVGAAGGVGGDGGGATGGSSGGRGGEGGNDLGFDGVVPPSFTRLTLRSSGGMPDMSVGECDYTYDDTVSFERRTRTVTWDRCYRGTIVSGSRVVTELEARGILNVASLITLSPADGCGYDAPEVSLDVEAAGATTRYYDDFYACYDPDGDRVFVRDIDPLVQWLFGIASTTAPAIPAFEGEIQARAAPILEPSPDPGSSCVEGSRDEFTLDLATRMLSWDYCAAPDGSSVYASVIGSRELTEGELAALEASWNALEVGASRSCPDHPALTYVRWPEVEISSATGLRICDEATSCLPDSVGGLYAVGFLAFYEQLTALAR
ncbi:MAG: hypothetical protein JW751_20345 [Polyangiaceae bacterium]|nr:hypothetical protein [Polyangiaceae bacterium]